MHTQDQYLLGLLWKYRLHSRSQVVSALFSAVRSSNVLALAADGSLHSALSDFLSGYERLLVSYFGTFSIFSFI